jgi:TetR/AcrR family transcriptional regulator, ethionamide resistance regulator
VKRAGAAKKQLPARPARGRLTKLVSVPRMPRRRRRPEEAEQEILEAAERFLRERPFHELTVDEVMSRTGLSRPSFYQYFRDRNELVIRLVDRLSAEIWPMSNRWFEGTGDSADDLRRAYAGVTSVWAQHGPVLRAIADASTHDPLVEDAYRALTRRFVAGTTERIRSEAAAGRIRGLDPETTAEALIAMSERYLNQKLGRLPQAEPQAVADTLTRIWLRTLYGRLD